MARLEPAKPRGLGLIRRFTYRTAKRSYGIPTEPVTTIAHHRPSMIGYGVAGLMVERYFHGVGDRLKKLAMLRAAQLTGCEWCLDFGSMLAQKSGIPQDTLRELPKWRSSERFGESQIVELTMTIAMENMFGRVNWALGIHGEGFSDGMYCVAPDREATQAVVAV